MGIFDNKVHLALVAIVGFAIIGMVVVVPSFAATAQENSDITPVQLQIPPAETPEATPEEEPSPAPEGGLPAPEEGAPAPEEPATPEEPTPFGAPAPEEPTPAPEETIPEPFGTPAPEEQEGLMSEEEQAPGAEDAEGKFSTSMTMSPTPDSEGTVTVEGAGMRIEDMDFEQSTEGATSKVKVQATFSVEPDGSEPVAPARQDGSDGFFNAVQFSPAQGSWANIIVEGTGLTVQGMSVNQVMGPAPPEEESPLPEETPPTLGPESSNVTPTQFPSLPETPEPAPEAPAPGEEPAPAPEEVPAPEEPTPEPFATPSPAPEEPAPEPFGIPAPEEPAPGEESEGLAPEEEAEPAGGEIFTVTVEVTFATEGGMTAPTPAPTVPETTSPETTGAPLATTASITLVPASAAVGSSVTIAGVGFAANQQVTVTIDGNPTETPPVTTEATGDFVAVVTIPADMTVGNHEITASDASGNMALATFTVEGTVTETTPAVPATPIPETITAASITLDVTSGTSGSTVTVDGTGFEANSSITLLFDGADMGAGAVTADATGALTATVTIPADAALGAHEMLAQDAAGTSASASFIVEAAAEATIPAPETIVPEATPTVP